MIDEAASSWLWLGDLPISDFREKFGFWPNRLVGFDQKLWTTPNIFRKYKKGGLSNIMMVELATKMIFLRKLKTVMGHLSSKSAFYS